LIKDNIDEVTDMKMMALKKFEKEKIMVVKAYNIAPYLACQMSERKSPAGGGMHLP
jgi:hypothetical protein